MAIVCRSKNEVPITASEGCWLMHGVELSILNQFRFCSHGGYLRFSVIREETHGPQCEPNLIRGEYKGLVMMILKYNKKILEV